MSAPASGNNQKLPQKEAGIFKKIVVSERASGGVGKGRSVEGRLERMIQ